MLFVAKYSMNISVVTVTGILVGFDVGDCRVAEDVCWGQHVLKLIGS